MKENPLWFFFLIANGHMYPPQVRSPPQSFSPVKGLTFSRAFAFWRQFPTSVKFSCLTHRFRRFPMCDTEISYDSHDSHTMFAKLPYFTYRIPSFPVSHDNLAEFPRIFQWLRDFGKILKRMCLFRNWLSQKRLIKIQMLLLFNISCVFNDYLNCSPQSPETWWFFKTIAIPYCFPLGMDGISGTWLFWGDLALPFLK